MRLLLILFSFIGIACLSLSAQAQTSKPLLRPYKPSAASATVADHIHDIYKQTGIVISYSTSYVNGHKPVSLPDTIATVKAALTYLLADANVDLIEKKNRILIVPSSEKTNLRTGCILNGYIKDAESREVLIGAVVALPSYRTGGVTNNYGFYSVTVPRGKNIVYISYIGYKTDTIELDCTGTKRLDILLRPSNTLQEVKVSSSTTVREADFVQLSEADMNRPQTLLGENDVLRALQAVPGVQCGIDGSSSIMVRGGDPGQNLFLLDGVPLYYVDHFFGFTSVYNSEAIKSVDFYKGAFPSRYGDRLSSIVDVHTRDGNMERIGGQFSMGLVKATLNLEGPIVKDKASFMVSARRTWVDALVYPFIDQLGINFYDINAKGNWIINKDNRIYVSFYTGRDQIRYSEENDYLRTRWGNTIASAKWATVVHPKFFLNTIFTYSQFRYELKDRTQIIDSAGIRTNGNYTGVSQISEGACNLQGQWFPSYNHKVELGVNYAFSDFTPTEIEASNAKIPLPVNPVSNQFVCNEATFYLEDEIRLGHKWKIRPGIRYANWFNREFNYSSFQPRLYASYAPSPRQLVYVSATHMAQFLHLISNNSYGLPTDFWVPSTDIIKPEKAWLGILGYSGRKDDLKYTAELYYKDIEGVITYTTGKNIFDNSDRWQSKIIQGHGWSYGLELSAEDKFGPLEASLSYCLSWNMRRFDQINGGKAFPYRYDRRHSLKIAANYQASRQTRLSANWTFMSGEAFTIPDQIYQDLDHNLHIYPNGVVSSNYYTYNYAIWNNYRLPAIHRLDLGISFTKKKERYYERTWSLGVFNAYGRPNVMFVTLKNDEQDGFKLEGLSFLQFIPYITYKLKF